MTLETEIKTETEKRLFKLAAGNVSDFDLAEAGERVRLDVAVEVAKKYIGIAQQKTIDYCQALKRSDGYIPWNHVKKYNREFKETL